MVVEDRNIFVLAVLAAIFVVIFIYTQIREKMNLKRAATGEDMENLRRVMAAALPGETGYTVAYAHWEDVEYYGRRRKTTYYCYGLAFDDSRLWVSALGSEKGVLHVGKPFVLTKDTVGTMTVTPIRKGDTLRSVSVVLRDKNGENPIHLDVDVQNTRSDRFHPVDIVQQAECEQFERFIAALSGTVSKENAGLEERLQEESVQKSAKSARTLGILGLCTCWLGFIGLIFGGIGLLTAPKPSQTGGKAGVPFILCLVSTILSTIFMVATIAAIILS